MQSLIAKMLFIVTSLIPFGTAPRGPIPNATPSPAAAYNLDTAKVTHLDGIVDYPLYLQFIQQEFLTASMPGDRVVYISSPGGSVEIGNVMLKILEAEQAHGTRLVCVVVGGASSMAFNILSHCDVRLSAPGAHFVVHKVAIDGLPSDQRWTVKNLRKLADEMEAVDEPFRQYNAVAMGLSLDEYDAYADLETDWSVEELLRRGYLNGVVTPADMPHDHK